MAIFSLNHRTVGRTTHAPRTASAYARYITRESACTRILGSRMPLERGAIYAWLDGQEEGDRKNARVADKVMVALPIELSHAERAGLLTAFAEDLTQGRASWVAAIHDGPSDADNPHAHLIFRDRDFETGRRVMQLSERGSTERLRLAWERHANAALERAGVDARIDRRSLEAQGIEREAGIHVGPTVRVLDDRGERPQSTARTFTRIVQGERKSIVIDYRKIDSGRTRLEENQERERRNAERTSSSAEAELRWTGRGGMVAEQRSATEWVKAAHRRNARRAKNGSSGRSDEHAAAASRRLARKERMRELKLGRESSQAERGPSETGRTK